MNIAVGSALLGCENESCAHGVPLRTTNSPDETPKALMIGSTLYAARHGDVIAGAGLKPLLKAASSASLARGLTRADAAVQSSRAILVRGPMTCDALRSVRPVGMSPLKCSYASDPALFAHLLVPAWHALPRRTSCLRRAARPPPKLCVVPHLYHARTLGALMSRLLRRELGSGAGSALVQPCRRHWMQSPASTPPSHSLATPAEAASRMRAGCDSADRAASVVDGVEITLLATNTPHTLAFARGLLSCDLVASTALHGLILADALRVPAVWLRLNMSEMEKSPEEAPLRPRLTEPDFKYHDYFASLAKPPLSVRRLEDALSLLRRGRRHRGVRRGEGEGDDASSSLSSRPAAGHRLPDGAAVGAAGPAPSAVPAAAAAAAAEHALDDDDEPRLRPRLELSELLERAIRFVRAFPFSSICEHAREHARHAKRVGGGRGRRRRN